MESAPQSTTQPLVEYEGEIYARAGNLNPRMSTESDFSTIVGLEAIDAHVEQLFDIWEQSGNIDAAIDVCTIISQFPEHYAPVPQAWYDNIYASLLESLQAPPAHTFDTSRLVIHIMQVPPLYERLAEHVITLLQSLEPSDCSISTHNLISNFLSAYAQTNLGHNDTYRALYHFTNTCKSDDSEL